MKSSINKPPSATVHLAPVAAVTGRSTMHDDDLMRLLTPTNPTTAARGGGGEGGGGGGGGECGGGGEGGATATATATATAGGGLLETSVFSGMIDESHVRKTSSSSSSSIKPRKEYIIKLAFLMDVTGSMKKVKDAVLARLAEICDKTVETFFPRVGIEVGFVGYRDVDMGERQFAVIPFIDILANDTNLGDFINQLKAIECTSALHGDIAENVLGGMDVAFKQLFASSMSSRGSIGIVFHFGDAPHHGSLFNVNPKEDHHAELEGSPRPYQVRS